MLSLYQTSPRPVRAVNGVLMKSGTRPSFLRMSTVLKHEMRREEGGRRRRRREETFFSFSEWKHSAHISTQRGFGRELGEVEKLVLIVHTVQ